MNKAQGQRLEIKLAYVVTTEIGLWKVRRTITMSKKKKKNYKYDFL